MEYLTPKNWGNFQHYKDRSPAWIKLHGDLLDDFDFHCLPIASKALAPMLWLLASKYEGGKIPLDYTKIAFRLRMTADEVEQAAKSLISCGFFIVSSGMEQDASESLAQCLPRGEESKRRGEESKSEPAKPSRKKSETPLPENFEVSERVKAWATENGFTDNRVSENFAKFLLWSKSKDKRYSDWDAALMTAIRDNWAKVEELPEPVQPASASPYRQWRPQ